jgi:hypothetical protein
MSLNLLTWSENGGPPGLSGVQHDANFALMEIADAENVKAAVPSTLVAAVAAAAASPDADELGGDILTAIDAVDPAAAQPKYSDAGILWTDGPFTSAGLLQAVSGGTGVQAATGLDVSPTKATLINPGAGTVVVTGQILRDALAPRIVTLVAGAADTDANLGLSIIVNEGANNIVWDENIWDNIPLDKELDVWVKANATARTHTWQDTLGNLLMPDDDASPFNATNCWKHFIFKWLPSPTNAAVKTNRLVMYGGTFS